MMRPAEYSNYNTHDIEWGELDNYECYHKLGRGKYSEVYLGCNKLNK